MISKIKKIMSFSICAIISWYFGQILGKVFILIISYLGLEKYLFEIIKLLTI
jgi:hypothetical protein